MANPYRIDPEALRAITRQVQEQKLVTLRDDATRPPPTFGTPVWQSSLFGSWLGQPASRLQTFDHEPRPRYTVLWVLLGLGAIGLLASFLSSLFR